MICGKCGNQVPDGQQVCASCGTPVGGGAVQAAPGDASSMGFAILSFIIPVLGLILFLIWKDQTPLKAKSCGKGALAGVIAAFAVSCILTIIFVVLLGSLPSLY